MAETHTLTGDGHQWRVVMHVPIPDADNAVGVNWRTALIHSGLGGTSALTEGDGPGQIGAAELAQVQAGAIYEHAGSFLVESGGVSAGELRAALRQFYADEKARVLAQLQTQLRYFGYTESES